MSFEVSRLCRDNVEWHQLLRIADMSNTLILDEHGVYDARDLNDWLLLGIKGQLSEFELRGICERMIGGQRSKAMRGELKIQLPIGLVYTESDRVVKDPDRSIREAIELVFSKFRQLQSIVPVTRWFQKQRICLPSRFRSAGICWGIPSKHQIRRILCNPRYGGCYAYGRTKPQRRPDGSSYTVRVPMDQWLVCIPEAHVGYIHWQEYLENQDLIHANAVRYLHGSERIPSPRKGIALLQSRIICGVCGNRMLVRYAAKRVNWYYVCEEGTAHCGKPLCQSLRGDVLDAAVGQFIVSAVNRENIALSLMVRQQLRDDFEMQDQQRKNHIQAQRHQADLARRRYMEVDPSNRLVATTLEAEWEAQLKLYHRAVEERNRSIKRHDNRSDAELDKRILELADDFGKVWDAPETANDDRKCLLGLIIENITLTRIDDQVQVGLRLRGGKIHMLDPVPLPPRMVQQQAICSEALEELEILLEQGYTDSSAAKKLNRRGYRDARGKTFNRICIYKIRIQNNLKHGIQRQRDHLRTQGYKSGSELAAELGISYSTVKLRAKRGDRIEAQKIPAPKRNYAMYRIIPNSQKTIEL